MASPLDQLKNSSVLVQTYQPTTFQNGRYQKPKDGPKYLIRSYLQRIEGRGTSTGEARTWGSSSSLGGGRTSGWLLKGYAIEYYEVQPGDNFIHGESDESVFTYTSIVTPGNNPTIAIPVRNGMEVSVRHGKLADVYQSKIIIIGGRYQACLLYTSPSPRDRTRSRMPSSA